MYRNIIAFGDSITDGMCDQKVFGWVGRLRQYVQNEYNKFSHVINLGIAGNTSDQVLNRFENELKYRLREPDEYLNYVLFGVGLNDSRLINGKPEVELSDYKNNISEIIQRSKKHPDNFQFGFIGLTPIDGKITKNLGEYSFLEENLRQYDDAIRNICEKEGVHFIEMREPFKKEGRYMWDDGLHPNAEGYDRIFEIIKKDLIEKNIID